MQPFAEQVLHKEFGTSKYTRRYVEITPLTLFLLWKFRQGMKARGGDGIYEWEEWEWVNIAGKIARDGKF
jgi:hypothetical protein